MLTEIEREIDMYVDEYKEYIMKIAHYKTFDTKEEIEQLKQLAKSHLMGVVRYALYEYINELSNEADHQASLSTELKDGLIFEEDDDSCEYCGSDSDYSPSSEDSEYEVSSCYLCNPLCSRCCTDEEILTDSDD